MSREIIPKMKNSIEAFLFEEEGNITRNKVLTVGSMMLIMGVIMTVDAFAAHRSHSSHKSHGSHSSGASRGHSSHESHVSHTSSAGGTHSSHSSSTSAKPTHTNTQPSHTNVMPDMSGITIKTPPATEALRMADNVTTAFALPDTPKIK